MNTNYRDLYTNWPSQEKHECIFYNENNNQLYLNKKEKENATQLTDQKIESLATRPPEPMFYVKGITKTNDIIPTKKEFLAKGNIAKVYEHRENPSIVVKKALKTLVKEYEIGAKLHHPNLVKFHNLYIKKYPDSNKYKLAMDKIEGKTLTFYYNGVQKVSDETARKLLLQAQNCCLYLFNQQVAWGDINDGNIFVVQDKNDLMLVDFGQWQTLEDPKARASQLLIGSMEIVGWIVKSSSLRQGNKRSRELEQQMIFPKEFFGEQITLPQILSILGPKHYSSKKWMQNIQTKIAGMNEMEIETLLKDYFDHVLEAFNQVRPIP